MTPRRIAPSFACGLLLVALSAGAVVHADDEPGHSHKATAFDSGMRQRPWFDQGNTLLRSLCIGSAPKAIRSSTWISC